MQVDYKEIKNLINLIDDCDRALAGEIPPVWLKKKIKQAQEDTVKAQREALLDRLRSISRIDVDA